MRAYLLIATINITARIIRTIPAVKIVGESTQNHDHAITFVSLSTTKATVKRDENPMPLDELEELAMLYPLQKRF